MHFRVDTPTDAVRVHSSARSMQPTLPEKPGESVTTPSYDGGASTEYTDHSHPRPIVSDNAERTLSVQISLRRGRLALLVGLVVAVVVVTTLMLEHGLELMRFDRRTVSVAEQEKLLDRYNSYSGNLASVVGRPLDLFMALMAHVLVLWLMTDSVLLTTTSTWRVKLTAITISVGVGFLLTTSLNALNVQVRELPVKTIMSTSDLTTNTVDAYESRVGKSSTVHRSFSERRATNPSTNTILRNLMLPRKSVVSTCPHGDGIQFTIQDDTVSFSMQQRAWMEHLIPRALPTQTIRIDLLTNETNGTATKFPIDSATIGADLLVTGVSTHSQYAPFDSVTPFNLGGDPQKSYPVPIDGELYIPTARLAGLLPPTPTPDERNDRQWFLNRSSAFIRAAASAEWRDATTLSRWTLDVSRVNITPSIWVDAVTIESEVSMNKSIAKLGSTTGHAFFEADSRYPDAQVHAFAVCLNKNGTETMLSTLTHGAPSSTSVVVCEGTSDNSMYVFSSGWHLVADDLVGQEVNSNRQFQSGQAKNLRLVSSTTFARVSWRLQNLSAVYETECVDFLTGCMGLDANLADTAQRLVVSADELRSIQLEHIVYTRWGDDMAVLYPQLPLEIVTVRRPTEVKPLISGKAPATSAGPKIHELNSSRFDTEPYKPWLGDVLLTHNVARNSTPLLNLGMHTRCQVVYDRRVQNYINNHLYIESTLQTTYTAAAFLLFQNGIAKDELPKPSGVVSLQLDMNVREVSVRLSVPKLNANLTLAGCAMLVAALFVALIRSHRTTTDSPLRITVPHQIARVMVDDTTFPSLLLKRHVTDKDAMGDAERFSIDALSVQPTASMARNGNSVAFYS